MFQWRVVLMAALAVLLLLGGLLALILPDKYEGTEIYRFDEMHVIRTLDVLGGALIALGCTGAWGAGVMWQRRMHAS